MSTEEMQVAVDDIQRQIASFRSLFRFMMEMGDFDGMEDAFNGVVQIAHGALTIVDPTLPLSDPTRVDGYALMNTER